VNAVPCPTCSARLLAPPLAAAAGRAKCCRCGGAVALPGVASHAPAAVLAAEVRSWPAATDRDGRRGARGDAGRVAVLAVLAGCVVLAAALAAAAAVVAWAVITVRGGGR
jgi:hypothetical protein